MPPACGSGPTRRGLLARLSLAGVGGLAVATATACTGPGAGGEDPPVVDPRDAAATAAATTREIELIRAYDTAVTRHPALAEPLTALRDHHAEHLRTLAATPGSAAPAIGSTAPIDGGGAGATPADSAETTAANLSELADLERIAAAGHRKGCLDATGALAPLLASLCAAESAHADLLGLLEMGAVAVR